MLVGVKLRRAGSINCSAEGNIDTKPGVIASMEDFEFDSPTINSSVITLSIIEAVESENGAGVTTIAKRLDLAKSTVHNHLNTLLKEKYLIKRDGKYYVSLKFLDIGQSARLRREEYPIIREKVEELSDITDERAQFVIEEHGVGVYLYRSIGEHGVPTSSRVGQRIPLHATAAGKAILANLPDEKVDSIIEQVGLEQFNENTIIERDELMGMLSRIRENGYAINDEESWEGVRAVAVPVMTPDDEVLGGLSVSGSVHRFKDDRIENELLDTVSGAANEIKLNIMYD